MTLSQDVFIQNDNITGINSSPSILPALSPSHTDTELLEFTPPETESDTNTDADTNEFNIYSNLIHSSERSKQFFQFFFDSTKETFFLSLIIVPLVFLQMYLISVVSSQALDYVNDNTMIWYPDAPLLFYDNNNFWPFFLYVELRGNILFRFCHFYSLLGFAFPIDKKSFAKSMIFPILFIILDPDSVPPLIAWFTSTTKADFSNLVSTVPRLGASIAVIVSLFLTRFYKQGKKFFVMTLLFIGSFMGYTLLIQGAIWHIFLQSNAWVQTLVILPLHLIITECFAIYHRLYIIFILNTINPTIAKNFEYLFFNLALMGATLTRFYILQIDSPSIQITTTIFLGVLDSIMRYTMCYRDNFVLRLFIKDPMERFKYLRLDQFPWVYHTFFHFSQLVEYLCIIYIPVLLMVLGLASQSTGIVILTMFLGIILEIMVDISRVFSVEYFNSSLSIFPLSQFFTTPIECPSQFKRLLDSSDAPGDNGSNVLHLSDFYCPLFSSTDKSENDNPNLNTTSQSRLLRVRSMLFDTPKTIKIQSFEDFSHNLDNFKSHFLLSRVSPKSQLEILKQIDFLLTFHSGIIVADQKSKGKSVWTFLLACVFSVNTFFLVLSLTRVLCISRSSHDAPINYSICDSETIL